jgi:hypothetical protein
MFVNMTLLNTVSSGLTDTMSITLSQNETLLLTKLQSFLHHVPHDSAHNSERIYVSLNQLRDWVNHHIEGVELYLEDVWHERIPHKTCFEYLLRSLRTKDETDPIGYDCYSHHQDSQGVWHLGHYEYSTYLMPDLTPLILFLRHHGPEPWEAYLETLMPVLNPY